MDLSQFAEWLEDRTLPSSIVAMRDDDLTLEADGKFDANSAVAGVQLPGLYLVDPTVSRFDGQIIYLDLDGADAVTYRGPVTVGPFDVPAIPR